MRHFRTWLIAGLATLMALAFMQPSVRASIHELLYPFDNALLHFRRSVGTRLVAIFRRGGYAVRIRSLENAVGALRMETADCVQLEEENARLRALLNYPTKTRGVWLPAPVLAVGGLSGQRHSFRIGKGSEQGLAPGAPVATPDGLVGRISEVSAHTAEVMPITDPNCRVPVEISVGADMAGAAGFGCVRGVLGGGGMKSVDGDESLRLLYVVDPLRIRFLERDFEPPVRAKVTTSGVGRVFPKGLMVGWVLESRVEADGLSREAEVAPAVDFASLSDVFVLLSGGGGASE